VLVTSSSGCDTALTRAVRFAVSGLLAMLLAALVGMSLQLPKPGICSKRPLPYLSKAVTTK
jgi:uncharacterized membrane protein YccC